MLARVSSAGPPVSGRGGGYGSVKFVGQADNGNSEETSAMPLHQKVGEIFLANRSAEEREAFSNSLKRFRVKNRGINREVVLLDESPHTHEVGYRYPLAGNTGRHVRDVLNKEARRMRPNEPTRRILPCGPIGRFVHDGHLGGSNPEFHRLGIMNVSQLPFQSAAYDCIPWADGDCRGHAEWRHYTDCMKTIRGGPHVCADNRRDDKCGVLDRAIAEDLRVRLRRLHSGNLNVLLVCCGPVAQEFYTKAGIPMRNTCDLPHPSRQGWKDLNPQQDECLREILGRIWPP